MYSWGDSMEDWRRPGAYRFDEARKAARKADAERAKAEGPRTYHNRNRPVYDLIDPRRTISSKSRNPLVIAVDVTGSMQNWPFEIFDRLPLLYQTLSQYRQDLEISFAAIGDIQSDEYPLQVTDFARGFDLEQRLKALYGEGGGGDSPEDYGMFAVYAQHRIVLSRTEDTPFMIVFGDVSMHEKHTAAQIKSLLDLDVQGDVNAIKAWQQVAKIWNVWFLRRPGGRKGDSVDQQWAEAIGEQKVVHITEEPRAVDFAMGLIARHWGKMDDFRLNMQARQEDNVVDRVVHSILSIDDSALGK